MARGIIEIISSARKHTDSSKSMGPLHTILLPKIDKHNRTSLPLASSTKKGLVSSVRDLMHFHPRLARCCGLARYPTSWQGVCAFVWCGKKKHELPLLGCNLVISVSLDVALYVITVCRGSKSDCKVHLFVDLMDGLHWRLLCGLKVGKIRGFLGLARVPKDLEEGQGPCRKKEEEKERRVIERG